MRDNSAACPVKLRQAAQQMWFDGRYYHDQNA